MKTFNSSTHIAPDGAGVSAVLGGGDSDSYEEGISDADNIVNAAAAEKVILVVSFGTSYNQSRKLTIGGIEAAIQNAYPAYQVRRAFTSQIIIDKLAQREGLTIDNVTEAMNRLVTDGVKEVVIQPTTVMNGSEYDDMIADITPFAGAFASLKIGKHLLCDDIDYHAVAELLVTETAQFRSDDTAFVYMGHGTEHAAGAAYTQLQNVLIAKGYNEYVIGTVEHGIGIEQVQQMLSPLRVKRVVLCPLMVVAGDHANNDMAGDEEDSWKIILEKDGYDIETVLRGLGEIAGIQDIYIRHVKEAMQADSLRITPTAFRADTMAAIPADQIRNGTYSITVDSDASMFRIVDCQLTVDESGMTAVMTLGGQGYAKLYMGKAAEASADEGNQIAPMRTDDAYRFTVPVAALEVKTNCAVLGTKSGNWYDHTIVFKSTNLPAEALLPSPIDNKK